MLTGLTCSQVGLTDASTSLTYAHTGLIGASSELGCSTKAKIRIRPSFKELLAKYQKKGAAQEKKRLNKAKNTKPSLKHCEQLDSRSHQGNCAVVPYSFDKPVVPWFWSYPGYYTSLDYSRIHMQLYFIQYPSIYPSCGTSQRPISNNLVKKI